MTAPPLHEPLSAKYKLSFAYKTFIDRVPRILQELMTCTRDNEPRILEQCGEYARFDLRRVIWSLDMLRFEIMQNQEFKLFYDKESGATEWNSFINRLKEREKNQWFSAPWLHAECYLYRRIWIAFHRHDTLRKYDYFSPQKKCAARNLVYLMRKVIKATKCLLRRKHSLRLMLKLSLWANRCDLSISTEQPNERMMDLIAEYDKHLVVDQSEDVWQLLTEGLHSSVSPATVDIVLDNAGYELFADLLLGEYLIKAALAQKVRYHVKDMPWFISDVTAQDFRWMLRFFQLHELPELSGFGRRLQKLMLTKQMELCETNSFWTRPQGFCSMRELAPCLYVQLSLGALTIFKGDLNYRKLLDDINCNPITAFSECLGGFLPTSICALRAIKSDIYCGMPLCAIEWLTDDDPKWMVTGEKGVIQVVIKKRP